VPTIFDNIENYLLKELKATLQESTHADFCVGYFNLRGWKHLASAVDAWPGGPDGQCRLLVGMQTAPRDELRDALSFLPTALGMDNQTALRLKKRMAEEFRNQLTLGRPSNQDEAALRALACQIRAGKVLVKLFLRHPLHAKLYLAHREDRLTPIVGYLGSSNLTFAGLSKQGELNVDILEQDAGQKLQRWFDERWDDRFCVDISDEVAAIVDQSWARADLIPPYHVYLKIAYHLSREARAGLAEFRIPRNFDHLFDFQKAAVKIAARHLNQRHGVVIGDVVGLGKTLMATALARVFQEDQGTNTLIICPKNLVSMWEYYRDRYGLAARVISLSRVENLLPDLPRFRVVLIDESHNLRNPEGRRYRAIQEYIRANDSRCILLSATPYNKSFLDLSAQLRLFVNPEEDLGIRPEHQLRQTGETEFIRQHQCRVSSLAAFEKSEDAADWRELMRRYLVRRTRSFIQDNYAHTAEDGRQYLSLDDGRRSYFPRRVPKTVIFELPEGDQYATLFSSAVVDAIDDLALPRYGLGNYIAKNPPQRPTDAEQQDLGKLSRAGQRLMGFCRTNLFKRLESSGLAFLLSVERHILRNHVYLHAIEHDLPIPIGTQDPGLLDTRFSDDDPDRLLPSFDLDENAPVDAKSARFRSDAEFRQEAASVYDRYTRQQRRRFTWIRPSLFGSELKKDLLADTRTLTTILDASGPWDPAGDAKLAALERLLTLDHPNEKVVVFTQFADTVAYLAQQLKTRGVTNLEGVSGASADATALAWRFSPLSNDKRNFADQHGELRCLVATDVLSEGQNLQDAHVVVNFDLPWAIIRLIQRAGRVDRIGQEASEIRCYSFLPAEGIERIIRLRSKVRRRLRENAEVVGADEHFFEDDRDDQPIVDLYHEKAGVLDGDGKDDVDFVSHAYQIWKNATDADPKLARVVEQLPDVVYTARDHHPGPGRPGGVLVYLRTADDNDALAWVDHDGHTVTANALDILTAAACHPATLARPRANDHHDLVALGVERIVEEEKQVGGQLGRPSGARFRTYERLKIYAEALKGAAGRGFVTRGLFDPDLDQLDRAIQDIYQHPLRPVAADTLNRLLRSGATDDVLAARVIELRSQDRFAIVEDEDDTREPRIICSLGLLPLGATS
jgi:hypothetical protein